jgi:hypothetical protein
VAMLHGIGDLIANNERYTRYRKPSERRENDVITADNYPCLKLRNNELSNLTFF